MIDESLRAALTETAHMFSGSNSPMSEYICDALRGIVARAGRYDALETANTSPVAVQSPDTSSPVASAPAAKGPCMTTDCGKPGLWKGLCRSCYGQALRLLDQEQTTWEELELLGLCTLEHKPFTKLFHERRAKT